MCSTRRFGLLLVAMIFVTSDDETGRVCPPKSIKDSIFASLSPPLYAIRHHDSSFGLIQGGIKPEPINESSLRETVHEQEKRNISGPENCPFLWAQSPVNMLQHETYLTLATIFVVLRLVYLGYPLIMTCARVSWRRRILSIRFKSLWEHPLLYMN